MSFSLFHDNPRDEITIKPLGVRDVEAYHSVKTNVLTVRKNLFFQNKSIRIAFYN